MCDELRAPFVDNLLSDSYGTLTLRFTLVYERAIIRFEEENAKQEEPRAYLC